MASFSYVCILGEVPLGVRGLAIDLCSEEALVEAPVWPELLEIGEVPSFPPEAFDFPLFSPRVYLGLWILGGSEQEWFKGGGSPLGVEGLPKETCKGNPNLAEGEGCLNPLEEPGESDSRFLSGTSSLSSTVLVTVSKLRDGGTFGTKPGGEIVITVSYPI